MSGNRKIEDILSEEKRQALIDAERRAQLTADQRQAENDIREYVLILRKRSHLSSAERRIIVERVERRAFRTQATTSGGGTT